jgi:hypothetical protein
MPQIMGTFHSYYFCTVTTAIMVLNVFIIKNACSFGYKRESREELEGGIRKQRGKIRAERKTRKKTQGGTGRIKKKQRAALPANARASAAPERKKQRGGNDWRERLQRTNIRNRNTETRPTKTKHRNKK